MNCTAQRTRRTNRREHYVGKNSVGKRVAIGVAMATIILFGSMSAHAQERVAGGWRMGGFFGWGLIDHQVHMSSLPGVPSCCPEYTGGSGNGIALGAGVEIPFQQKFSVNARLLYAGYSGLLEAEEEELVTAERDTVRATFLHSIDASQSGLAFEAFLTYQPIRRVGLFGGLRSDFILSTNFHQEERILEPSNIRYENNSRIRLVSDGDLPGGTSPQFSLLAGLRYDLPLNASESMTLVPEIAFWHGLSPVVADRDWQMRGVRLGLELQFTVAGKTVLPSPLEPGENDTKTILPEPSETGAPTGSSPESVD